MGHQTAAFTVGSHDICGLSVFWGGSGTRRGVVLTTWQQDDSPSDVNSVRGRSHFAAWIPAE